MALFRAETGDLPIAESWRIFLASSGLSSACCAM